MAAPSLALTLKGVTRTEKGVQVPLLSEVSFELAKGKLLALVGADGAGKTTLMRVLAGLLKPQAGDVYLFGENLYDNVSRLQKACGYMPEKFGLYQDLSVMENLTLYADLFGLDEPTRKTRFASLLQMTDLGSFTERLAGDLSGGMKQKLGLACALLNHPKVLLLDEPSVGVDPLSRRELWKILRDNARQESMTVVVATTYMDEAALCDEVVILEEGRVVIKDTPQALAKAAHHLTFFVKPRAGEKIRDLQAKLLDDARVLDAVPQAGGVHVLLADEAAKSSLLCAIKDHYFEAVPPTLEDGYLVKRFAHNQKPSYGAMVNLASAQRLSPHKESEANATSVIVARDLMRTFGDFVAVDRTSIDVYPGEIFGLLGPNGAGKTTTFKMLCGLLSVSGGELEVAGVNVKLAREQARENLGYMSQKFSLYGDLSVMENLQFFAGAYGLFDDVACARIEELLQEFNLEESRAQSAKSLSGGIKQRLAMAVALLHRPKILFLDEPTSGADIPTRRQFWRWITALANAGTTIIVTTHFMQEAQYCDRLLIQDAGKSLVLGTPESVRGEAPSMDEAFIRVVRASRQKEGRDGSA